MVAEDEDAPLPFDVWVSASARILRRDREEQARVLESLGLDPERWSACELHWSRVLVEELGRGETAKASAYGRCCRDELSSRRAAHGPLLHADGPSASDPLDDVSATVSLEGDASAGPTTHCPRIVPAGVHDTADAVPVLGAALPFIRAAPEEVLAALPSAAVYGGGGFDTTTVSTGRLEFTLPFSRPRERGPEMTLERFAALFAELAVAPDQRDVVLSRYDVPGEAALQTLEQSWWQRLGENPLLHARWRSVYDACLAWLARTGRP